jgi:hypothetical protein
MGSSPNWFCFAKTANRETTAASEAIPKLAPFRKTRDGQTSTAIQQSTPEIGSVSQEVLTPNGSVS